MRTVIVLFALGFAWMLVPSPVSPQEPGTEQTDHWLVKSFTLMKKRDRALEASEVDRELQARSREVLHRLNRVVLHLDSEMAKRVGGLDAAIPAPAFMKLARVHWSPRGNLQGAVWLLEPRKELKRLAQDIIEERYGAALAAQLPGGGRIGMLTESLNDEWWASTAAGRSAAMARALLRYQEAIEQLNALQRAAAINQRQHEHELKAVDAELTIHAALLPATRPGTPANPPGPAPVPAPPAAPMGLLGVNAN